MRLFSIVIAVLSLTISPVFAQKASKKKSSKTPIEEPSKTPVETKSKTSAKKANQDSEETPSVELPREDPTSLASDRPGFVESTSVVPLRSLQAEFGVALDTVLEKELFQNQLTTPQLLLRYGYKKDIELRLVVPDFQLDAANIQGAVNVENGFGNVKVGAKYSRTLGQLGVSLVPAVTVPTTLDVIDNIDTLGVELGANVSIAINPKLRLAGSVFAISTDILGLDGNNLIGSINGNYLFSDILSGYAELILDKLGSGNDPIVGVGGGYLLYKNIRLDANMLLPLGDNLNNITLGGGGAVRF